MKIAFLVCLAVTAVTAAPAEPAEKNSDFSRMPYERYIDFPDGDEIPHTVDLEEQPDESLISEIERNPANNVYQLFTRRNPTSPQTLVMNNPGSITGSNFNPAWPTVVVIHGWYSHQDTRLNPTIRNAVLNRGDANVIIVEWRRLAMSNYVTAVRGVPAVGRGVGQFLNLVNQVTGAPFNRMHLVGFSLGAHVVGNAGRQLGGRIGRITGLDPAGPLWVYNSNKLNVNNAIYVECIHTDGNTGIGLGIGKSIGNVDFWPNGGTNQPGCLTGICDHNRAWDLFAATVTHDHLVGNQCSSSLQISLNRCTGPRFNMGNDNINKRGSGDYRVNTGRRWPY